MLSSNPGVYILANTETNDFYVGSAYNLRQRFNKHKYYLRNNKHHSSILQRAWDKYGESAFVFKPVIICEKHELLRYEQELIDRLNPRYNIVRTAGNTLGYRHTEAAKQKISEAAKSASEETREKKRAPLIGRIVSLATRQKMSLAQKGKVRPPLSEEHKRKISESEKGVHRGPMSEAHRKKLSLVKIGKPHAPHSLEAKEKMRQAALRRYERERLIRSINALQWL